MPQPMSRAVLEKLSKKKENKPMTKLTTTNKIAR
jgi:hypothetical protein